MLRQSILTFTSLHSWTGQKLETSIKHTSPLMDNLTDCLTKSLQCPKFQRAYNSNGMCSDLPTWGGGGLESSGKGHNWCYNLTYQSMVCGSMWTQTCPLSYLSHISSMTEVKQHLATLQFSLTIWVDSPAWYRWKQSFISYIKYYWDSLPGTDFYTSSTNTSLERGDSAVLWCLDDPSPLESSRSATQVFPIEGFHSLAHSKQDPFHQPTGRCTLACLIHKPHSTPCCFWTWNANHLNKFWNPWPITLLLHFSLQWHHFHLQTALSSVPKSWSVWGGTSNKE